MATHQATKTMGRLIQAPHLARNGQLVTAAFYSKTARAQNHIMGYRGKWLGGLSQPLQGLKASESGTVAQWRMYFRSGHGADRIIIRVVAAVCDDVAGASLVPTIIVSTVNPSTGAAITAVQRLTGIVEPTLPDVQDNFIDYVMEIDVDDDTAYGLVFATKDYARIVSATVYEAKANPVDDTTTGAVDPRYSVGDPIQDGPVLAMAQGQTELLKSNRRHLLSWSSYGDSSIVNATDTYENVLDGTSTTVTAATPGQYVNCPFDNTLSRTGVPMEFAVYAEGAGNGGVAQITDGTNTLTTGTITTAGFYVVAGLLPAAAGVKYDVWAKTLGGGEDDIVVSAYSLLEYE